MYGEFVQPSIDEADLVIDGTCDSSQGARQVVDVLAARPIAAAANS